jgi:DNA-binding CsgD family transcriptional regulator
VSDNLQEKVDAIALLADQLPGVIIIHDLKDWKVYWMSEPGLQGLGITLEELKSLSNEEYYSRFFSEEDLMEYLPMVKAMIERNVMDETITYFQKVRIKAKSGWVWHMSSSKVLIRNEDGVPIYIITMSFAIDAIHHMTSKAARLLEESTFLRKNFQRFSKLSMRECEVLKLLALGKSSAETAAELFISLSTVDTHRKNIRRKLGTSSFYELGQYARAFDLI